jgi:glycosyltransferase involved in cell wall biosynthesis
MANDGFACVEVLRGEGVDAELIIDECDFGMGLPQWETTRMKGDPYKLNPDELPKAPDWVKTWRSDGRGFLYRVSELTHITRGYDLLHLHFPTMIYLLFTSTPYLVYEAGFIRQMYAWLKDSNRVKLGKYAYQRAKCVTYTNTDTKEMVAGVSPKKMEFVPFAINTERYTPVKKSSNSVLELIHPARMVFDVKGNDRMLKAYVNYIQSGGRAHLTLVDWGYAEDVAEAHQIIEPVKRTVTWVSPMSKPSLIEAYQHADAVLDQFTLGASGTTGFEAMACGTPLMMYFAPSAAEHFGEAPPCVNASTQEEILSGFMALESDTLRRHLSTEGRRFAVKHLGYKAVAQRLRSIYKEVG